MRSARSKIIAAGLVLGAACVAAWQVLPGEGDGRSAIRVGTTDVVSALDPAGAYDAGSWALFSNVYQSLLTIKPGSGTPAPDAASSCKFVGQKLTTYQCELRPEVKFAGGRPITAEDVKHSFDRIKAINSDQGPAPLFNTLESVKADGRTVTFNLSAPDATFPFKIATGAASIVDKDKYPAKALREDGKVDGSGPYTLGAYKAGASAELTPNASYKGDGKPAHVPVTVRYFKDSAQLNRAWQDHGVEVAHRDMPPDVLAGLNPGLKDTRYQASGGTEIRSLVFNVRPGSTTAPPAVRQAVAAALDRSKVAGEIYAGTVTPLYSLVPAGVAAHSTPFFDTYPAPNGATAKKLLKDARITTPVSLTLGVNARGANVDEAVEIKRQLEATGLFQLKIKSVEQWGDFQKGYAAGEFDAYTVGWIADFPDADNFLAPLVGADSSMNNGFSDKTVDALITRTQSYSERADAAVDFRELQRLVAQQIPVLPIWQKKDYVLSREAVTGAQYLSDGTGAWRLWELDWL
ncbi:MULTISPECIES: ABC transporter substrate-binding protein [unclassified Streptomyces]|uniref:ABC transporter substrate-binding protein n=1 Tax=unclassified Streptomyces TaxID=2593676 RepID=UPI001BE6F811|nr:MULTISPECIES: ABC transporter substrate-binding protein [unclassified Streptomyces]MBT2402354.1 peptide-binding protein [Streptomyces sp. ISL-21]MBT2455305.1 peptide-binding protein [Streptomyces sp. ISL-86]MBT2607686.1 peptide-binding protein [Streptomyces sp. ISL-87]